MSKDPIGEAEIEETVAALRAGAVKLGGGPTDQGWVVRLIDGRLWFHSWYALDEQTVDEETREVDDEEVRAMLRRYGRKVIRKA